jgi:hypothetical protein
MVAHPLNWYAGWSLILTAFLTGAVIGLAFHKEDFLGGYTSFRRRIVRLGHISLDALGAINLLYAFSPWPVLSKWNGYWAGILWLVGGITMPLVCFLTGWRQYFRHLFFIPVSALVGASVLTLIN